MTREHSDNIYQHNIRIFYIVDALRALWFISSIWVLFERQYLTMSQITLIEALILGVALVMQLPTGAFADIFGRKKAMIIGCLLYAISIGVYSMSNTMNLFLIYALFMGMAESFIEGTREALLYDTLKEDHKEELFPYVSSKLSVIFQITLALATLIGGIIGMYSYIIVIRMTMFSFFLAAVSCIFYREPVIYSEKFSLAGYIAKVKLGTKEIMKNSYIKKISLYYVLIGSLTYVCAFTFNTMLLSEMKYTTAEMGVALGLIRIVNSVVFFRLISIGKIFTRRVTFTLLPVIIIFSFIPTILFTKWFVLLSVIGALFVSGARWNLLSRYTNAEFESKNRATAISTLAMAIGILYVFIMGSSGFIIEHLGGVRMIYTILGVITLVTALPLGIHLSKNHS